MASVIGKLRHRVIWQTPDSTRDEYGQVNTTETYTQIAIRTVAIEATGSSEILNGGKPDGVQTYKVTQRYLPGLKLKDRMFFNFRYFEVVGILNIDERNQWQEVTVTERPQQ
ncbi:MAG: head-tail adaptor protein [Planctomycetaceae bacterium]